VAWDKLLGVDLARKKTCPFTARPKGALGRLAAMLYVTECNGRKSLHIHALSYGALLPEFVARVAHDPECRRALLGALDTQITGQLRKNVHLTRLCQKALFVPVGYDASFPPFQTSVSDSRTDQAADNLDGDSTITGESIRMCGQVVAMQRNVHKHGPSCQKPKRGVDGCRFCAQI
jgi:hypothetical protein